MFFLTCLTGTSVTSFEYVGFNICSCLLILPSSCRLLDFCHDRLDRSQQANKAVVVDEVNADYVLPFLDKC